MPNHGHNSLSAVPISSGRLLVLSSGLFFLTAAMTFLGSCTSNNSAGSGPQRDQEVRTGLASFYGRGFHGKETASGKTFDKHEMVAAHPTYPLGTKARITNLENGRVAEVQVIDRGPTEENQAEGVIIDLSEGAAAKLGILKDGRAQVKVEVLEWGSDTRN